MNKKALINYLNKYGFILIAENKIKDNYFGIIDFMFFEKDNLIIRVGYERKTKDYGVVYRINSKDYYIGFNHAYNIPQFKHKFKYFIMKISFEYKLNIECR
jgi:hypothetical protein